MSIKKEVWPVKIVEDSPKLVWDDEVYVGEDDEDREDMWYRRGRYYRDDYPWWNYQDRYYGPGYSGSRYNGYNGYNGYNRNFVGNNFGSRNFVSRNFGSRNIGRNFHGGGGGGFRGRREEEDEEEDEE